MEKTVCELFAGVGGFRCGLNNISELEDTKKTEKWDTVWFKMPLNKRRFMMGNALVVNLVKDMEKTLADIFEKE